VLDALLVSERFKKLLPVFGSINVHDVLILIKGIKLYQYAFMFDLTVRLGPEVMTDLMRVWPRMESKNLTDDQGTEYSLFYRGSSGGMNEWRFNFSVTPGLNPDATVLTLEIPRLEIQERGRGSIQTPKDILNGPWIFKLTLPPKEERE
jgi:hypothetical protein